ncbi:MAG: cation:proton antiporter [Syntrophomonadaceae bacterium]
MEATLLQDIVVIFSLAVVVLYLCHSIKVPSIVGFLLTGIIAGPHGLALVKSIEQVQLIAEFGVILLLFSIGLEFSFKSLMKMKTTVLVGGSLQVGFTILLGAMLAYLFGLSINQAVFIGFLVSLSSTAIVLKQMGERAELDSPHGKINLGILIFQDIIVVVMMLLVPLLGGAEGMSEPVWFILAKAAGVIFLIIILSIYVIPPLLYQVTRTGSRELFMLSIIVICFAVAELTNSAGLSLALGAFMAGLIIADSEYSHQALANIIPFLDTFTSLFFVSIGMLLNLSAISGHLGTILLITAAVLLTKAIIASLATLVLGYPLRTAILVGFSLSQVGEFSFILSQTGIQHGLISQGLYQGFLSASILTMMLTPFIIAFAPQAVKYITQLPIPQRLLTGTHPEVLDKEIDDYHDHLIIIGYGLNGRNLSRAANYAKVPYIALDLNSETVRVEQANGEPIYYGDATQEVVLEKAGVEKARVMVIAISDPAATRRIITTARRMSPGIHIIVRTRFISNVDDLHNLGANEVIPEEYETSIEIFARVLNRYLVPVDEIESFINMVRSEDYEMFRSISRLEAQDDFYLQSINLWTIRVGETFLYRDAKISEVDFRNRYGISVIAIRRNDGLISNPGADDIISMGDLLIVIGEPEQINQLFKPVAS